jgi:hypothetical protein
MTDYSRMSYEALRQIADNDSAANHMSDEEYECLSVELWRKFSAEKGLTEHYPTFVPLSASKEERTPALFTPLAERLGR